MKLILVIGAAVGSVGAAAYQIVMWLFAVSLVALIVAGVISAGLYAGLQIIRGLHLMRSRSRGL